MIEFCLTPIGWIILPILEIQKIIAVKEITGSDGPMPHRSSKTDRHIIPKHWISRYCVLAGLEFAGDWAVACLKRDWLLVLFAWVVTVCRRIWHHHQNTH